MPDVKLTSHAKDMLAERNIAEEWIWRVLNHPDKKRLGEDGNMHYVKSIKERNGLVLHVVVNPNVQPNRVVTVFFDRRVKRNK
ncbi:MAG: DUF4258 domain-containing protein [Anaerolineales bacterium]|nr:DUF4258 domain-containing protein [Anaerolineales bacterium]